MDLSLEDQTGHGKTIKIGAKLAKMAERGAWQPLWIEPHPCFGCWAKWAWQTWFGRRPCFDGWTRGRGNHELGHAHVLTHCLLLDACGRGLYNRCGGRGRGNRNNSSSITWWTWQTMGHARAYCTAQLAWPVGGVAFYRMVLYMALYILCLRLRWSFINSFRIKVFLQTGHKQGLFSWRWTVEKCLLAFRNPEKLLPHRLHWPPPSGSLRTPPSGIWPSATGNGNTCVNFQYYRIPKVSITKFGIGDF